MEMRELGKSNISVPALGVGTMLWIPNKNLTEDEIFKTYKTCVDGGLNFFDTAEIYGNGKAERVIGQCIKKDKRPIMIATKFAPPSKMIPIKPKRTVSASSPRALLDALNGSLSRLGIDYIDFPIRGFSPHEVCREAGAWSKTTDFQSLRFQSAV